jgi:hypothetical protein
MVSAAKPAPATVGKIGKIGKSESGAQRHYRPLEPGELRRALRDTKLTVGLLGLRWASLARRALFGRRHD